MIDLITSTEVRTVAVYGPSNSGKTDYLLMFAAAAHMAGRSILYMDFQGDVLKERVARHDLSLGPRFMLSHDATLMASYLLMNIAKPDLIILDGFDHAYCEERTLHDTLTDLLRVFRSNQINVVATCTNKPVTALFDSAVSIEEVYQDAI